MRATHLLALTGLAVVLSSAPAPSAGPGEATPDRSCKPHAPIAVDVSPRAGGAGLVTLDVSVRPVLEMEVLGWSWELSPGVALVQGQPVRELDGARGALTQDSVQVLLPAGHATATLVVTGRFTGRDERGVATDEVVQVERTTRWGEAPLPAPLAPAMDGETGQWGEVLVVPSAHRAGR